MDILVCMKRVPDTETRVKVHADGRSLDPSGVQFIIAPYDEIAVEKAIQLKEQAGAGSVTVLTLGPAEATKELRTALAMGADAALHAVSDAPADALATARALAGVLAGRRYDLILCGKQATDEDDGAVGPMLAALLDLPCVTFASALAPADGGLEVRREIEGVTEVLWVPLPCLVTAQKGLAEPRYPGLKGIMAAKKKPLDSVAATVAESPTRVTATTLPPARSAVKYVEATREGCRQLIQALRNDEKVL